MKGGEKKTVSGQEKLYIPRKTELAWCELTREIPDHPSAHNVHGHDDERVCSVNEGRAGGCAVIGAGDKTNTVTDPPAQPMQLSTTC